MKRRATARPRPVPFERGEGLEQAVAGLLRHPRPLIGQGQHQAARPVAHGDAGGNVEAPPSPHGVPCVGRDVADRPTQLVHVQGGRSAGGHVEVAHHLEPRQLLGAPRRQLLEKGRQEHVASGQGASPAGEVQGLRGHALQPIDALHDQVRPEPHFVRGKTPLQEGLRVAAYDRHRPPEVVSQHPRHGAEGCHALARDQLLLVVKVLQGEGRAGRDDRHQPCRLRADGGLAAPARAAEDQGPHEATPGDEGDERSLPLPPRGLEQVPVRDQVVGLGSGDAARLRPPDPQPRLTFCDGEGLDAFELAVPEKEGAPGDLHRGRQGPGQEAGEALEVRGFQDLVREPLKEFGARDLRPGV